MRVRNNFQKGIYITFKINRNKGKSISLFLYKCDVIYQNKFSAVILGQKKISNNVLKQCFTRLLVAETPDSDRLQQGGN